MKYATFYSDAKKENKIDTTTKGWQSKVVAFDEPKYSTSGMKLRAENNRVSHRIPSYFTKSHAASSVIDVYKSQTLHSVSRRFWTLSVSVIA